MRDFIGTAKAWNPSSSGERLLFLLLRHHVEWVVVRNALAAADLQLGRRHGDFSDFYLGAALLHLLQRIIKTAGDHRNRIERRDLQTVALAKSLQDLGLTAATYDGDFGELLDEALRSAEIAARETIPPSVQKTVRRQGTRAGVLACYSCDRTLDASLPPTADHVWPAALGGDTTLENLVPSCATCNSMKLHVASWQMAWIQPEVHAFGNEHALKCVPRNVKMALHMRAAFAFAHANGSTLKEAYVAIGPRHTYITLCDNSETVDFFNMRVHDPVSTNVDWMPR